MTKIKQSLQNLNLGEDRILNRKELKQIMGGNGDPCSVDHDCPDDVQCFDNICAYDTELECVTPNGTETWRRRCSSAQATADCRPYTQRMAQQ